MTKAPMVPFKNTSIELTAEATNDHHVHAHVWKLAMIIVSVRYRPLPQSVSNDEISTGSICRDS